MKCPSDHGQDETKIKSVPTTWAVSFLNSSKAELSRARRPRRRRIRIPLRWGAASHGNQRGFFSGETWILRAWSKRHAGRRGEQDSEQDDDDRISSLLTYEAKHKRAEEETGDRSDEKQPQISRMKVFFTR